MKGALIKRTTWGGKDVCQVQLVVDISNTQALDDFRVNLNYDYALIVNNDVVAWDNFYDENTGIITDKAGNRVYPPATQDEILFKLSRDVDRLTYNVNTNELTLDELKEYLIAKNKNNLEKYLYDHPMVYDHKVYTVSSDKQNQLTGVLQAYTYAKSIGIELPLTWNETGAECVPYSFEALVMLYLKMLEYVKPIVTYQQHNEILIRNAKTADEAISVDIDFSGFEPVNVNIPHEETPKSEPVEGPDVTEGFVSDNDTEEVSDE